MNENPLVSVIIPTYKRVEFLDRALKSVLKQSYKNIEIIIVDDNEPNSIYREDTAKLVNKYKLENDNIKYIKLKKNSGGCVARNEGIKLAKGKYVNFLDDDDEFHEFKIEKQVNKMETSKKKLAVVGCLAKIVDSNGNVKRIEKEEIKGEVFIHQLGKNVCTTSLALIDREVCEKSGGFIKIPSSQEHLFFIKIFEVNPYYDYVDEELININHHLGERVSNNKNKPLGALELFEHVKKYFNKLDKETIRKISVEHYENIIRAYLAINERKVCIKYLLNIIKIEGVFNKRTIKLITMIFLGLENIDKIKKKVRKNETCCNSK